MHTPRGTTETTPQLHEIPPEILKKGRRVLDALKKKKPLGGALGSPELVSRSREGDSSGNKGNFAVLYLECSPSWLISSLLELLTSALLSGSSPSSAGLLVGSEPGFPQQGSIWMLPL